MLNLLKTILSKFGKQPRQSEPPVPDERQVPRSADGLDRGGKAYEQPPKQTKAPGTEKAPSDRRSHPASGPRQSKTDSTPPPPWDISSFEVPPEAGKVRFHDLELPGELMHAIADLGFRYCTPIQAEVLPSTLAGKDASGRAQTGTGKTAAFLITVITRLLGQKTTGKRSNGTPRVLILGPTRELVMQIAEEGRQLAKYTDLTITPVFGGMDYEKQRQQLTRTRSDIVVATPGRLLDFKRQGDVRLDQVEILIIDEADRMLDMGFIPDVRKIIYATPHKQKRQTLLFSATLTPEVTRLAAQWTTDPISVEIEPQQVAVDSVEQIIYIVTREEKVALLYNIINGKNLNQVIVFCNRKDETRRLADLFERYKIDCAVLSGDVRQRTRVRTLDDFKEGKIRVLVATDVAGRGIHIEGMDHVINYTLPRDPEDYVHRIGRTGRAGASGTSISFADEEDSFFIPPIEELIGYKLPCIQPEEEWLNPLPPAPPLKRKPRSGERRSQRASQPPRRSRRRGGARTQPPRSGEGRKKGDRRRRPKTPRKSGQT